jgi:hypothetical protein
MSTATAPHPHSRRESPPRRGRRRTRRRLGHYLEGDPGAVREIVYVPGAGGSILLIDRFAGTHSDPRLVAHLAADESTANARIVCSMYLADPHKGTCRPVDVDDLELVPFATEHMGRTDETPRTTRLLDRNGVAYRICEATADGSFPELRWTRSGDTGQDERLNAVTLRDVVARLQDYEPARTITASVLAMYSDDPRVSTCRLQAELERLTNSTIVLNRGLREAVQRKVARGEMSMSQIAMNCGRTQQDSHGNPSGATSWLARRIGQLPEGSETEPSPWVHTDVLALIARDGLGCSPHEMELG